MPTVVYHQATSVTREKLQEAFAAAAVDARVFFHPLSSLGIFPEQLQNSHAWDIPRRAMNLPSFHDMTDDDVGRVAMICRRAVERTGIPS
jgi:perosamine synthetase